MAFAMASVACAFTGCNDLNSVIEPDPDEPPLVTPSNYMCDVYKDYFSVGAAVLPYNIGKYDDAGLMKHFNSITAENHMKWRILEPNEGEYTYDSADQLVNWAKENDTAVRGHCLVWYKSLPQWLAEKHMTKEEALQIIDSHIEETMTHFGDSVYVWDVCNEALHSVVTEKQLKSGDIYRTGGDAVSDNYSVDWYELCGVDFIKQAFISADRVRKELGLDVKLYYNDYSLNNPNKRQAAVKLIEMLREDGIAIDGIGMQAHYRLPVYEKDRQAFMDDFGDSVKTFTELGLDVQITELDIQVYESNSSPQMYDSLPLDVEISQADMFADIFRVCRNYSIPEKAGNGRVTNITTWGVADDHTYATNNIHREFPLIFNSNLTPKRSYYEIITF